MNYKITFYCFHSKILILSFKDHIWKCQYVKKDLDWLIQKCDYLQDLNIFQKKLIHELEELTKIQKEKIKFIQSNYL